MKYRSLASAGLFFAIFLSGSEGVLAQNDIALETRQSDLKNLSQQLRQRDENDRRQVQQAAGRLGVPVRRELPNGRIIEFQRFAPGIGPIINITYNIDAADTVSTDEVWPGGDAGLDLYGNGMTVGEWDGGAVLAEHPSFDTRVTQVDGATLVSNHSTHVAGTLISSGVGDYPESIGMAYAASLDAYDWNSDSAEMAAAAADGLLLSNHSYGIAAGWLYIGGGEPDNWWWIGGDQPGDVEDSNFGYYDSESRLWDQIAFDAPYYLIVKAAGNDRSDFGPGPGEEYTVIDQDGNFLFYSTLPRDPDCAPAGYDCLPTSSVAKNILTVGAVDDLIGGYSSLAGPAAVTMTDFSGWGPTDDGRIKPDLVGNGVLLFSTYGEYPWYAPAIGTSMAAPNVTGSLLLLQEHYQDLHGPTSAMRAATLKALAIHTADETGDADGPDYEFGWGLLNTQSAAHVISEDGGAHLMIEDSLVNGGLDSFNFNVSGENAVLRATLAWTDPPGTPVAPSLDPPDLMLVNDLDLRIIKGASEHKPWVLDPANPAAAALRGDNFRDNVEQVYVESAAPGSYTVQVSHKGALLNGDAQPYSLIISEEPGPLTGSSFYIDEDFENGMPVSWTVETNSNTTWLVYGPSDPAFFYGNQTGGSGQFAAVKFSYQASTVSSLVTGVLDLSSAQNAVLQFRSWFQFDLLETVNVDVSTDGGASWPFTVWSQQGVFPIASTHVVDISNQVAGESNVKLRFRFDSGFEGYGNYWQIDDVKLEAFGGNPGPDKPGQAVSPSPADGATGVSIASNLDWTAGSGAASHDVYFGENSPPALQGNQPGTGFDPGTLNHQTTYYWRVDEVNEAGTTQGNIWSFTTATELAQSTNVHLSGLSPASLPDPRNRWTAQVLVSVSDTAGAPVSGVTVEGNWGGGTNGGASCPTDASGQCTVEKNNLKASQSSVSFSVTNLSGLNMIYEAAANETETTVIVLRDGGGGNLTPTARNDAYTTTEDTALNGNVMDNDDEGDAPATVTAWDATSAADGAVSMSPDGSFSYQPPAGFTGSDSFGYTLTDNTGDSDSATVSITVNPASGSGMTLSAVPARSKGDWFTELTWSGGAGSVLVTIHRDGFEVDGSPAPNSGTFLDPMGKKVSGTFTYEVCEIDSGDCAQADVVFP